jgi:hypothetical protein
VLWIPSTDDAHFDAKLAGAGDVSRRYTERPYG